MIELARELGLALANSAEFIRMKNAQNAVEQNEGINAALTELREKRERLVNILAEEETDNLEALRLTNDIDRLEGQLQDNPLFLELLEAQAAFSTVLRTINDEINACIGGETSESASCEGDCGSCGGCKH
ncbi:MAG TPA: YlbF family regulator [Clostridia bacterium]|nr:YlbF family regulator [Clostridia bacterium]